MSFRDFVTSLAVRRRADAALARYQGLTPPANPSRGWIDRRVRRLLSADAAYVARRELELAGAAAVPALSVAARDPRYHRAGWDGLSRAPTPLDAVLELLVPHAADVVVAVAVPMADSPDKAVRKTIALRLASTGRPDVMPVLGRLIDDAAGYVRSHVCMGVRWTVKEGRAGPEFRRAAYDLILPQCDQSWSDGAMNDAAAAVVALDPERAAADLGSPRWLTVGNVQLHALLAACNEGGVALPAGALNGILDRALPLAVGDHPYPHEYVAAGAVTALVQAAGPAAAARLAAVPDDVHPLVREAVAAGRATLAGAADPVRFVLARRAEVGYDRLTRPQRVVFNAFQFDADVNNGGLLQFFANASGDRVDDTLTDLRTLGHAAAVAALDGATRLIGPLARTADRDDRLAAFKGRGYELASAFAPLEAAYSADGAGLRERWLSYAAEHVERFRA